MDDARLPTTDDARAWRDLLVGLERLGVALGDPGLADGLSDGSGSEGYLHLAQQLLCWLEWSVGYGDPAEPAFQRQNDLVTPWGGPNADNVYRHARVSPRHAYVVRGRMHSCEEFALAIREGFRHTDRPATLAELTASDVGIGSGDDFELLLGGSGTEPRRVPLPEGAIMCSIREYYYDWRELEPATWTIERIGGPPNPPPPYRDHLMEALDLTERSLSYWNEYMRVARARQEDNTFGSKVDVPRGLQISQFLFCFYDLGPDEALIVESEIPDARYWSFQLYGLHYFRPFDIARPTSLNHRQVVPDEDGSVRIVLAERDPGVPNWLEASRPLGLLNYRHFWGAPLPSPLTRVVPVDGVRDELPAGHPFVTAEERAAQVQARRRHLMWRYRT
jgi:hypothetical protein